MMALLQAWLTGITAAAILCALADSLMPQGAVRKAGKLAGGLVMLAAILRPLVSLEAISPQALWADLSSQTALQAQALEETRDEAVKAIIEEELAAYILDKAAGLGVSCTAQVTCHPGENGVLLPEQAALRGAFTPEQQEALAQVLEEELGIPRARQSFQTEEGSP